MHSQCLVCGALVGVLTSFHNSGYTSTSQALNAKYPSSQTTPVLPQHREAQSTSDALAEPSR